MSEKLWKRHGKMSKRLSGSVPNCADVVEEYMKKYPDAGRKAIRDLIHPEHQEQPGHPEISIRTLNRHLEIAFPEKKRKLDKKSLLLQVKMLQDNMLPAKPIEVRKQAAKTLMALASEKEFPIKAVLFLFDNWNKPNYRDIQKYLLCAIWRAAISLKDDGRLQFKINPVLQEVLELAENVKAPPELRGDAWGLLVELKDQMMVDLAFKILKRPDEQERVWGYDRQEIIRYANKNSTDAKKRLLSVLSELPQQPTKEQIPSTSVVGQRVSSLLNEIRSQN